MTQRTYDPKRHCNKIDLHRRGWCNKMIYKYLEKTDNFYSTHNFITLDKVKKYELKEEVQQDLAKAEFIKQDLRDMGWTDKLFRDYLPEPDDIRKYTGSFPSRYLHFYRAKRVKEIIASNNLAPVLVKNLEKRKREHETRKTVAKKVAERRVSMLEDQIKQTQIHIQVIKSDDKLKKLACEHYNNWNWQSDTYADLDSPPHFINRIVVNFIRHQLTNYDTELENLFNQYGKNKVLPLLWKRVYAKISECYPDYKNECQRQLENKTQKSSEFFSAI